MMKKTLFLMVTISLSQSWAGPLDKLREKNKGAVSPGSSDISSPTATTTSLSSAPQKTCDDEKQYSLPLSMVQSLIVGDGNFAIDHNPASGELKLSSPKYIQNCSSMIEWKMEKKVVNSRAQYAFEARLKDPECDQDGKNCKYKFTKFENGEAKTLSQEFEKSPNGLVACLKAAGVINEKNDPVQENYFTTKLEAKFSGANQSGNIVFMTEGKSTLSDQQNPGEGIVYDGCKRYEKGLALSEIESFSDKQRREKDEQISKLQSIKADKCNPEEFNSITSFLENNPGFTQIENIRDQVVLANLKKVLEKLQKDPGSLVASDLKVFEDFKKYLLDPKVKEIKDLYAQLEDAEGEEKTRLQNEIDQKVADLRKNTDSLKPLFVDKLIQRGEFETAEILNSSIVIADAYKKIGKKELGVLSTPAIADKKIANQQELFKEKLEKEREYFGIRTGQEQGKSEYYADLVKSMRENLELRTQNYTEEIKAEYARTQPGGYCYAYFRNTTKCVQDSFARIAELQELLKKFNTVDSERLKEYGEKQSFYEKLEAEGRRAIALAEGVDVKEPEKKEDKKPVNDGKNVYSFDFNQGQQAALQSAQQYQQQSQASTISSMLQLTGNSSFNGNVNPYQGQVSGGAYLGQQSYPYQNQYYPQYSAGPAFNGGGNYQFNWNGSSQYQPYGQQPMYGGNQMPYMYQQQQPYMNNYNMYQYR